MLVYHQSANVQWTDTNEIDMKALNSGQIMSVVITDDPEVTKAIHSIVCRAIEGSDEKVD